MGRATRQPPNIFMFSTVGEIPVDIPYTLHRYSGQCAVILIFLPTPFITTTHDNILRADEVTDKKNLGSREMS